MATAREPIFKFADTSSTGLDTVPQYGVVYVTSEQKFYDLIDINGIDDTTTVQDAIATGKLVRTTSGLAIKNINSNTNSEGNTMYICESVGTQLPTDSVAYTLTLPASPDEGTLIYIMDADGNSQNRPILIDRNGNTIDGVADNLTCDVNYFDIKLVFNTSSSNWALGGK